MKKITVILSTLILCLILGFSISNNTTEISAKTYTNKSQVQKEVKSLNKKIKNLKKQAAIDKKKSEKYNKKYKKKKKKNVTAIILGSIESTDPFIVSYLGRSFYITNPNKGIYWLNTFTAEIKATKKSTYYNGHKYKGMKVVVDPDLQKSTKYEMSYKKKQKTLKKYTTQRDKLKKALSFKISTSTRYLYLDYPGSYENFTPDQTYYNTIKWTSSNPSVITVNSKDGFYSCKKTGEATITAQTNISGKKSSFKVIVKNNEKLDIGTTEIRVESGLRVYVKVPSKFKVDYAKAYIEDESICNLGEDDIYTPGEDEDEDEEIDDEDEEYLEVNGLNAGSTNVVVTYHQYRIEFKVIVYEKEASFKTDRVQYTSDDIGKQKTITFTTNVENLQVSCNDPKSISINSVNIPKISKKGDYVTATINYTILAPRAFQVSFFVSIDLDKVNYDDYEGDYDDASDLTGNCKVTFDYYGFQKKKAVIEDVEYISDISGFTDKTDVSDLGYESFDLVDSEGDLSSLIPPYNNDFDLPLNYVVLTTGKIQSATFEGDCCEINDKTDVAVSLNPLTEGTGTLKVTTTNGVNLELPVFVS